jgi:hypothetical protein
MLGEVQRRSMNTLRQQFNEMPASSKWALFVLAGAIVVFGGLAVQSIGEADRSSPDSDSSSGGTAPSRDDDVDRAEREFVRTVRGLESEFNYDYLDVFTDADLLSAGYAACSELDLHAEVGPYEFDDAIAVALDHLDRTYTVSATLGLQVTEVGVRALCPHWELALDRALPTLLDPTR